MKKLFFSFLFVCSFAVITVSCHEDDELPTPQKESSNLNLSKATTGSSHLPGCSGGGAGTEKTVTSGVYSYSLALPSGIYTDTKYYYRYSTKSGSSPRSFKAVFKNKSFYPTVVRAVGFKSGGIFGSDEWTLLNNNCYDLNNNGDNHTFIFSSGQVSQYDFIQFEVILMNRNYAHQFTGSNLCLTRPNILYDIRICAYTSTICNIFN